MNIFSYSPCCIRLGLPMAGWAAVGFVASTAAQDNKPPGAKDTDGNQYRYPVTTYANPIRKHPLDVDPRGIERGEVAIQHKLATIIIPHLNFHDTPLTDAIESIRQESRRLDPDPDPATHGFNIFLKLPAAMIVSPVLITAELVNMPVLEALKSVAGLAGLKVKVEPYAVSLVPLSENTEPMFTAEYRAMPAAGGLSSDPSPTPSTDTAATGWPIARRDARPWLESKGVTFPPGASATYLTDKDKLIVRNTQENIDRITALLDPSPKNP